MLPSTRIDSSFARFMTSDERDTRTPAPPEPPPQPVVAKMDMPAPDVCPYCKKHMDTTTCCGQTMYVCHDDRAVFPVEDSPGA